MTDADRGYAAGGVGGCRGLGQRADWRSDWMAGLPGDLPLSMLSMPGTHNSASSSFPGHYPGVVAAARCQARSLAGQLQMGVRFLDFRVRPDGALCHGRVTCVLTLRQGLETCASFLRAHPGEVILARFKDEGESKASARGVDTLIQTTVFSAEYPFFLQMRIPTLGEVRGRIVLLCDWAGGQLGLRWAGEQMLIQDQYWLRTGTAKWKVAKQHLNLSVPSAVRFVVHFTSATNLPRKVPLTMARSVNPKLDEYLRCLSRRRFVGIIVMDFPAEPLCDLIIARNWPSLDPCRAISSHLSSEAREFLDNLQCELTAAATRADALAHSPKFGEAPDEIRLLEDAEDEERRVDALRWLGRVYAKLLLERASAELLQPAVEEESPIEAIGHVAGASRDEHSQRAKAATPAVEPAAFSPRSPKQRGLLRRFRKLGSCFATRPRSPGPFDDDDAEFPDPALEEPFATKPIAAPAPGIIAMRAREALRDLECELEVAASSADGAALLEDPKVLRERVEVLGRIYAKALAWRVLAREDTRCSRDGGAKDSSSSDEDGGLDLATDCPNTPPPMAGDPWGSLREDVVSCASDPEATRGGTAPREGPWLIPRSPVSRASSSHQVPHGFNDSRLPRTSGYPVQDHKPPAQQMMTTAT